MCSKPGPPPAPDVFMSPGFADLVPKTPDSEWYENDLHLAAELGKTLLDQNLDLKEALRQHQLIIEDQNLEIEYLTKQTVALREVNESRVKIYEQLELTNQELETTNTRLLNDASTYKKKLASQSSTIELLDARCEELQRTLDDHLQTHRAPSPKPGPVRRHTVSNLETLAQVKLAPKVSCIRSESGTDEEIDQLHMALKDVQAQRMHEQRRRETLEEEVSALLTELKEVQEQLGPLQLQAAKAKTLQSELLAAKEANTFMRKCKKCTSSLEDVRGDALSFASDVEDEEPSVNSGVLIKLDNGVHAYGSQDSLWSDGHVQDLDNSSSPAPGSNPPSLLSELDAHYRNIIGKLIKSQSQSPSSMTDVLTDCSFSHDGSLKEEPEFSDSGCKASKLELACDHPLDADRPSCDHDSLSQGVQTEAYLPLHHRLHMPTNQDPLHGYFCKTPEYKTIFEEIFLVLRQSVRSKSTVRPKPTSKEKKCEMIPMTILCADANATL